GGDGQRRDLRCPQRARTPFGRDRHAAAWHARRGRRDARHGERLLDTRPSVRWRGAERLGPELDPGAGATPEARAPAPTTARSPLGPACAPRLRWPRPVRSRRRGPPWPMATPRSRTFAPTSLVSL